MGLGPLVAASLLVGAAVLGLLSSFDRPRRPGAFLLALFPWVGALSVVPGWGISSWLAGGVRGSSGSLWTEVLFSWTVAAPVEELSKFLCFALATHLLGSIRKPLDGLLQGAATGLGFGLVENLLYAQTGGWELLVLRTVLSLPGHVVYGAVWGGYQGFEVIQGRRQGFRLWVPLLALVPAVFAHALFNTLSLVGAPLVATLAVDGLTWAFGAFLFLQLKDPSSKNSAPPRRGPGSRA